jgi:eukaryotic-like serine/threonine-protein kinase
MVRGSFGRYQIVRKLGRSMTDVYLALDPFLKMHVVLKLIEQSGDHFTRIVIEAERRGAQIQKELRELDRRVLEVYDFGELDGCFFVAMEYFAGHNIAEILQSERRLDPPRACRYALEVLSQLERMHAFVSDFDGRLRAVVHGDIKPSNIQIGANDQVRLIDFGIAKMVTRTKHLTHHNLGSPTYCSPERLEKSQVDPHADLWAVGVSLYEMVSGALPYQSASTRKLENLIQSRRPPRALPSHCPPPLRAVIHKALGSQIECRYRSATEFGDDLRAFLDGRQTVAEREPLPSWDANETVRKPRLARVTRSRLPSRVKSIGAAWMEFARSRNVRSAIFAISIGIALGLLLVIPIHHLFALEEEARPLRETRDYEAMSAADITAEWTRYQHLARQDGFLGKFSPAATLASPMRVRLLSAADSVISKYRESSDPALANYEWSKARTALLYALEMEPSDHEARGKLALCDGYLNLIRNPKLPKAEATETNFQIAAADLPHSPDPHLALARLYTYAFRNAGKVASELTEAERRGFRPGPREFEQQADAYVFRAEYEIRQAQRAAAGSATEEHRWLRQASNDLERATTLYEPIAGFSNVNAGLDALYRDRESIDQFTQALVEKERKAALARAPHKARARRTAPRIGGPGT